MSQTKASTNKANKNAHNNSHGSSGSISSHNNGEKRLNSSASSSNVVGRAGNNPLIPMSRVKTIMKSSPEISSVNADTLFLVCKATVSVNIKTTEEEEEEEEPVVKKNEYTQKIGSVHSTVCHRGAQNGPSGPGYEQRRPRQADLSHAGQAGQRRRALPVLSG